MRVNLGFYMGKSFAAKCSLGAMALLCLAGCGPRASQVKGKTSEEVYLPAELARRAEDADACRMILLPIEGISRIDQDIARTQQAVREGDIKSKASLERLGWLFISKARVSFDQGYYKLAEQCAVCLDGKSPHSAEGLLLRGHVLHSLHRFKEAEVLGRELVARRGLSFDYGLLGDVLMEQGRLGEAVEAYQKMVDQKPDLQAYARIAHVRWAKGDLLGATQIMHMAAQAASPKAPESAAWVNTQLALLQFQKGEMKPAFQTCDLALEYQKGYPPALLLQGRLLLADGKYPAAVEVLTRACQQNPLPEYQWTLVEALRAANRNAEAEPIELQLRQQGAAADPRTFAVYLASVGGSPQAALLLAQNELNVRRDVFTHDALAWSLAANQRIEEAQQEMTRALAEGTQDARLYFHAAVIASQGGKPEEAERWLGKAAGISQMLLPSERRQLQKTAGELGRAQASLAQPPK